MPSGPPRPAVAEQALEVLRHLLAAEEDLDGQSALLQFVHRRIGGAGADGEATVAQRLLPVVAELQSRDVARRQKRVRIAGDLDQVGNDGLGRRGGGRGRRGGRDRGGGGGGRRRRRGGGGGRRLRRDRHLLRHRVELRLLRRQRQRDRERVGVGVQLPRAGAPCPGAAC